jgi:penicillin-binding protein 1C
MLLLGVSAALAVALLSSAGYLAFRLTPFPELERFLSRPYSTPVTDRKGRLLRVLPLEGGLRREYVSLDEAPLQVVEAFVLSEDKRFFFHPGFDGLAAARSLIDAARAGRVVSGASTITMQLAGMVVPGERSFSGKIREVINAVRIETRFSKSEILELWLNSLPFGGGAEGIQSGSRSIFGKSVAELTVPEALLLAVVPRRPRDLSPAEDPEAAVVAAMGIAGRFRLPVGEGELSRAAAFAAVRPGNRSFEAPHFLAAASGDLAGANSGRTSLDLDIQHRVEGLVHHALERYESHRIRHAAAAVLDTRTGEILAYLGSPDYFRGGEGSMIDAVRVPRRPGSCLKPFLYALALEQGYEAWNILPDYPLEFGTSEVYTPTDFDNRFRGPVRFRTALASSLNVPAVYLLDQLGVEGFADFLVSAGFPGSPAEIGLSGLGLSLGNREVSLLDLIRAFAAFPRGGTLPELSYLPVAGRREGVRIVSRYTAGVICSILSDDAARIPGFGSVRTFETPFPAVFKTGTSNQFQDIWALGATPRYTVGVWMGNLTGETVMGRTGSSIPLGIVRELLLYLQGSSGDPLPEPPGAARVEICAVTGNLAGEDCPAVVREYTRKPPPRCGVDHEGEAASRYGPEFTSRTGFPSALGGDRITILRPADGAVYYYDDSLPREDQAVLFEVRGGTGPVGVAAAGLGEQVLPAGRDSWYLPLRRGVHTITAERGGHSDSITIEVR